MAEGIGQRNDLQNPGVGVRVNREASEVAEKEKVPKETGGFKVFTLDLEGSSVEMRAVRRCANRFTPGAEELPAIKLYIAEDMSPATEGPRFGNQSAIYETAPVWEIVDDFVNDLDGYVNRVFVVLAKSMILGLREI